MKVATPEDYDDFNEYNHALAWYLWNNMMTNCSVDEVYALLQSFDKELEQHG